MKTENDLWTRREMRVVGRAFGKMCVTKTRSSCRLSFSNGNERQHGLQVLLHET